MAFNQYTECIEPSEYVRDIDHRIVALIQSLLVGATGTAVALVQSRLDCWPILLELLGVAWVLAYCRLFLYERLICLGKDQDAIGVVVSVDGSHLTGFPDNDFNVNLLPEPNEFGAKREQVKTSTPYGFLVDEQAKIAAAGLPTAGHASPDEATHTESETLHCEFEGAGAHVLLIASEVAFALTAAALILCVYLPPIPFLHQIITALALLALLALLLGGLIGLGTSGSPSDVNPNLGEIHTNNDPNNGLGAGADILFISGAWVYDPWHAGWNEIHPVKVCTKIGTWDGGWDLPLDVILRVRNQFDLAAAPETKAAQERPENQWTVHPVLDGCSSVIIT
jgi:hypothetical protein